MSIMKMLMGIVVLGVIVGLVLAYMGVLNMDKEGNVSFNQKAAENAMTASELSKANSLAMQTKYNEAIPLYISFIEKNPKSPDLPEARFRLAKCYEDSRQEALAIKYYKEYLKLSPEDTGERPKRARDRIDFLQNAGHKEAK